MLDDVNQPLDILVKSIEQCHEDAISIVQDMQRQVASVRCARWSGKTNQSLIIMALTFAELDMKARLKKAPSLLSDHRWHCPSCSRSLPTDKDPKARAYCSRCGQAIKWDKEETK